MEPVVVANVTYYAAAGALLAALAALLAFTPGATTARRVLALAIALASCTSLATAAATAWAFPGAVGLLADLALLAGLALFAFFALYPTRVRPASLHGALFLAGAALFVVAIAAWLFARDALFGGPDARRTIPWHWFGPYGETLGMLGGLAVLSALARIATLPAGERRGATVLVAGLALPVWLAPGAIVTAYLATRLTGDPYMPTALGPIAGDPFRLTAALWYASWFVVPLAALTYAWLRLGTRIPLAFALLGLALGAIGAWSTVGIAWTGAIVTVVVPPYAMARYGALGGATAPRGAGALLAAAIALGAFLVVSSLAVSLAPDSPLVLALGVFGGLVAAGTALAVALPRARNALAAFAATPEDTRARLEPYRAILAREREAGAPRDALVERLRDLRASLGVSDHEHAVMEHALFGDTVARRGGPTEGRTILGRYRVERALREGGAGVTYLCRDERLGRDVVIKALRGRADDALDAVMHEARAMSRVRDARVVTLLDVERVGDEAYMVMEHVEGGSLADRLAARGALPREELRVVGDDLLGALAAVHAAGLVHRDVKPSNVLLRADGRAKLADFGIAHVPGFETTAAANPGSAAVAGTIRYMSPEHARGRRVDARSDLFSAAATLYEAATGSPFLAPEAGESAVELQLRAASAAGLSPGAPCGPVPRAFWTRALHPLASERFQTAAEMREAFARAVEGPPQGPDPSPA